MAIPTGDKVLKRHELVLFFGIMILAFGLILMFAGKWELKQDDFLGKDAPEIEYETSRGQSAKLSNQQGTVVLLNFWASWCAPCIEEMPTLKMLEEHFRNRGFLLLAFNIGGDSLETLEGKLPNKSLPENVVFNFPKEQLKSFPVDGIPVSVLISKKGKIYKVYRGPRNWMDLQIIQEIENLIKE
jgi:thiol-disulfide isomerase/thioredoxin